MDINVAVDVSYESNADERELSRGKALNEGREDGWRKFVDWDVVDGIDFGEVVEDPLKVGEDEDEAEVGNDRGGEVDVVDVDEAEVGSGSCLTGARTVESPRLRLNPSKIVFNHGWSSFFNVASLPPLPLLPTVPFSFQGPHSNKKLPNPCPSDNLFCILGLCGLVGL